MTDVVASWDDRNFSEAFIQNTNKDGRQYFLPVGADVYLLLANNNALPYLPDGADIDTITWEQYADWANAIAEGEGEGKVCITGIPSNPGSICLVARHFLWRRLPRHQLARAAGAWEVWATMGDGFCPLRPEH